MTQGNYGFCPMPDRGKINQLPSLTLAGVGAVLHNVHAGMASLIGELPNEYHRAQWLCYADARVASAALVE